MFKRFKDIFKHLKELCLENYKLFLGLIFVFIVPPIIIGQVLRIPMGKYTIGSEGDWVGFFGNYSGGIIGGIVAYLIAAKQIRDERERSQKEHEEKQMLAKRIVSLFLSQEIDRNFKIMESDWYFDSSLQERNEPFQFMHNDWNFSIKEFDNVKYELIKYDDPIIKQVLEVYTMFIKLNNTNDINQLSQEDYDFVKRTYLFWKEFRKELSLF
jgi:hypothetical protein